MRTHKPSVRIEDWAVVTSLNTASFQGLRPGNLLVGKVFGHPRISDGAIVFSSPILSFDPHHETAETRNTAYRLGEASRDYEAWARGQEDGAAA